MILSDDYEPRSNSMQLSEMNWMQVESYLLEDDRLILVLGATEQHGYLSLLTDVKIPMALAEAASEKTGVLVAPPLNFGCSPYFLAYPGTLSLRVETLLAVVEDLLRSVYRQGFRRVLVLNGHGGNRAAQTFLNELANQLQEITVQWYDWWLSPVVGEVAEKHGLVQSHANWLEAFDFTTVVDLPDEEKPMLGRPPAMEASKLRQFYGDGSFGGAYQAGDEVMEEIFAACLAEVLDMLAL
jgi:creatinine amidohydrolase